MPAEKTMTKASENRRSTKPIMEKRRRARINNSLAELKNLILDALKKDNARHSKLEKADILEMTVKHLENLQRQQMVAAVTSDPTVLCKFRAGFSECANEVSRYLGRIGLDTPVRQSLLNHLSKCMTTINSTSVQTGAGAPTFTATSAPMQGLLPVQPVHVQVPNPADGNPEMLSKYLGSVQLMPTRLPTGEIAFLLPAQAVKSGQTAGANLLSMCPSPAPSTSSCTSTSTSCSMPPASPSPVSVLGSAGILSPAASDRSATSPSPISPISIHMPVCHAATYEPISPALPVGKMEEEKVWRPW